jgi:hypothetical protein
MRNPLVALAGIVLLQACGASSEPEPNASITGPIVARDVSISIGGPPSIHVEKTSQDGCGIIFLVRPSTKIHRRSGGRVTSASQSDLVVGARVSVWTDIVLDSCPAQAGAQVIEILD